MFLLRYCFSFRFNHILQLTLLNVFTWYNEQYAHFHSDALLAIKAKWSNQASHLYINTFVSKLKKSLMNLQWTASWEWKNGRLSRKWKSVTDHFCLAVSSHRLQVISRLENESCSDFICVFVQCPVITLVINHGGFAHTSENQTAQVTSNILFWVKSLFYDGRGCLFNSHYIKCIGNGYAISAQGTSLLFLYYPSIIEKCIAFVVIFHFILSDIKRSCAC